MLVSVDPAEGAISYAGFQPAATDCTAPSGDASISIKGFAFDPTVLEVAIGATLTWTNEDSTQHTVTVRDGSFDSGALSQGETFSQTFNQTFGETFGTAGTIEYFCRFHPSMTGTITVAWPA